MMNNRVVRVRGIIGICLAAVVLMAGIRVVSAADMSGAESDALSSASKLFTDMQYPLAETSFSNFLATFTNSSQRAYATLYLSRAQLEQSNSAGAKALLLKGFSEAGALAPEYVFWIAKARFSEGDYTNAAAGFANVSDMALSSRRLEAAYNQALTHAVTTNWSQVIRLLEATNGMFRKVAASQPNNPFAALGTLLLGEALLDNHRYADAEKEVRALDPKTLEAEVVWRRQYLLCQINLAAGRSDEALREATNLLTLASGPAHQAAGIFLQGQILESLGRTNEALQAYGIDLADDAPVQEQRRAFGKTVRLTVAMNSLDDAVASLTNLIARFPQEPGLDLAHLSLGELYLKAFAAPPKAADATNAPAPLANTLENALANFNVVLNNYTNSQYLPKAHMDRGWCDWAADNMALARSDFEIAASDLPYSEDQAVARFKLGDAEAALHDYAGALTNYNLVLERYDKMESVTNELFDQVLYQIVEADLKLGDNQGALAAADKILRWFPNSDLGESGVLLLGEKLNRRQVFMDLLARSPNSPLAPRARYDIARTYDHEGNWLAAIHEYDTWVTNHPADPLLPEVEFYRAMAKWRAGMGTNALMEFTNFVARFPSNSLAPWAKNWVADYYYRQQAYPLAEINYEELSQNFPQAGDLGFQARFWAGRTALANQEIADARTYFSDLINNSNTPAALVAQSYFAFGDAAFQQFQANPGNTKYSDDAIAAVSKLTNGAPTNAIAVEAFGRLGDYYMHYADLKSDTNIYANAAQMYSTILGFHGTNVSVAARSEAEVALGVIAEKEHSLNEALAHYARVLYEYDPNNFDPYWLETAGENFARVCEAQQRWPQAVNAYKRVEEAVPALAPVLEKRIAADQTRAETAPR